MSKGCGEHSFVGKWLNVKALYDDGGFVVLFVFDTVLTSVLKSWTMEIFTTGFVAVHGTKAGMRPEVVVPLPHRIVVNAAGVIALADD